MENNRTILLFSLVGLVLMYNQFLISASCSDDVNPCVGDRIVEEGEN